MLHVHSFLCNALAERTYVVYDHATRAAAVVDPGCYTAQERTALSKFITQQNLQVTHLINTHAHIDHILGNQYVKDTYAVHLTLHQAEVPILQAAPQYAPAYGFGAYQPTEAEVLLTAGAVIQLGATALTVLHVPGHSPGHIALHSAQDQLCLAGDVLFRGGIGRTDLLGGDRPTLLRSIREQLFPLGDGVVIYPGHGPNTTIGAERGQPALC